MMITVVFKHRFTIPYLFKDFFERLSSLMVRLTNLFWLYTSRRLWSVFVQEPLMNILNYTLHLPICLWVHSYLGSLHFIESYIKFRWQLPLFDVFCFLAAPHWTVALVGLIMSNVSKRLLKHASTSLSWRVLYIEHRRLFSRPYNFPVTLRKRNLILKQATASIIIAVMTFNKAALS